MKVVHIFLLLGISFFLVRCNKKVNDAVTNVGKTPATWRAQPPSASAPRPVSLGSYHSFDLDNGLKVIVVENHKLPRVSYQLSLNNDPISEGDKIGYIEFAGDLLSKGTKSRTKADIDNAVDFIGGSLNTSSSGIYASSLKKHSTKLLDVFTDVLYNPSFPEDELDKMRKRAVSGLAASKSNPESIASNVRHVVNYTSKHPYGEIQTEETLRKFGADDCKKYYDTYFKPNNAYLVVVGDITLDEARNQVNSYFSQWKRGDVPVVSYNNPSLPTGSNVHFANKDGAVQSVINVSYPVDFRPGNPDAIKASVMSSILGGSSFSGRLMQNLREKHAYTYGARCNLASDKIIGNFNAFASVRNAVTDSAVVQFLHEMKRITSEQVEPKELSLIKNSMSGSFARSLESPQTIANFALNVYRYNLPKDYYDNYLKTLEAVTADDVLQMAKKYVHPDKANIIVVGNESEVAEKLLPFDSDGVIDYYSPFGEKLEQPEFVIPEGMNPQTILNMYFESIGGLDKMNQVQNITTTLVAEIMGQPGKLRQIQTSKGQYLMSLEAMGMILQKQVFDGKKGMNVAMGNKQMVTEEKELKNLKNQSFVFSQLNYLNDNFKLSLMGLEKVQSRDAYKVKIENSDGDVTFEYYDVKTGRLLRSVNIIGKDTDSKSISTDYSNYKEVNGVYFPHSITTVGVAPEPLIFNVESLELNKVISDDTFKVE
ncbi:MAG: insulinase family protein [Saprospiraceae bacterium]